MWLPLSCPLPGTWPATQACALIGNQTCDPLVHRPALNPLIHISQGTSYPVSCSLCGQRTTRHHWMNTHAQAPPQPAKPQARCVVCTRSEFPLLSHLWQSKQASRNWNGEGWWGPSLRNKAKEDIGRQRGREGDIEDRRTWISKHASLVLSSTTSGCWATWVCSHLWSGHNKSTDSSGLFRIRW